MKSVKTLLVAAMAVFVAAVSTPAFAKDYTHSTPGISGYDPVAYFTDGKPMRGSGYQVSVFEGVTYAFASEEHKEMFEANPEKYVPAYGGYCAYGVAVGKKFVTDPEVWRIVDGTLYLNLDRGIQRTWEKDVPGYIKKADVNWSEIKDKAASDL
ncbi:YHS domain-containing protein [Nitrospiraceae bacterium AH_259_D15_M11_P09]|nr:YHS domain-containing protein [Nitrospiraceae bacterium AH_259_D15_M11_P09]